jgi:hypothetical protein
MHEIAIRRPCMAESADRFGYSVQVLPYPPPAEQSYRARFARARNSRELHCGKRWPIWVSFACTPLSVTRKAILPTSLCLSKQFASPVWRKALADLGIQCRYSPIRHTQSFPPERVMCELAIREACMAESAGRFGYPVHVLPYSPPAEQSYRARYARARNSRALHCGKRWPIWVSFTGTPLFVTRKAIM